MTKQQEPMARSPGGPKQKQDRTFKVTLSCHFFGELSQSKRIRVSLTRKQGAKLKRKKNFERKLEVMKLVYTYKTSKDKVQVKSRHHI
jgi:hypothetical protein